MVSGPRSGRKPLGAEEENTKDAEPNYSSHSHTKHTRTHTHTHTHTSYRKLWQRRLVGPFKVMDVYSSLIVLYLGNSFLDVEIDRMLSYIER